MLLMLNVFIHFISNVMTYETADLTTQPTTHKFRALFVQFIKSWFSTHYLYVFLLYVTLPMVHCAYYRGSVTWLFKIEP